MKLRNLWVLIIIYFCVIAVQFSGMFLTFPSLDFWYEGLVKPSWNPPNWVFGPVWTVLYMLMSLSIWLIYLTAKKSREKRNCYLLFGAQLIANGLWTFLFFYKMNPMLALIDIVILLSLIGLMIGVYSKISKAAAYLLVPYFLWVAYATSLNIGIVVLN
jgi:benzodiazapine receptor